MDKVALEWIGCGLSAVLTVTQSNEIFQLISLIFTLLSSVAALAFTIYKWVKKSKADGKITVEEIEELGDILVDGANKLNDVIDDSQKEE